jgi:hypothetical protein
MQPLRSTEENSIMTVRLAALMAGFLLVVGLPLAATAGPTPGGTSTADGDDVEDAFDNCTTLDNDSQKDTDHDGCGNLCDADFDQDGATSGTDFFVFKGAFGTTTGQPLYNPAVDLDCDGAISGTDFFAFKAEFTTAPGPSGISSSYKGPSCP